MCAGDTAVEIEDKDANGITGIGTTHRCVDYGNIVEWVDKQIVPDRSQEERLLEERLSFSV